MVQYLCCLSAQSPAAHLHECPVPCAVLEPTYISSQAPPGSPNASPDSGPQSLILTVITTIAIHQGTIPRPHPPDSGPALLYPSSANSPHPANSHRRDALHRGPQAMPALLETRGYVNSVLPATQSINPQGRAPVGLRPELPRLPGGRLQLTAAIHVRPCSPARTNTTLFQPAIVNFSTHPPNCKILKILRKSLNAIKIKNANLIRKTINYFIKIYI